MQYTKTILAMQKSIYFASSAFLREMAGSLSEAFLIHYQQSPGEIIRQTLARGEGELSDSGALVISTGRFTGRSPEDRFIVDDDHTHRSIDWNTVNQPLSPENFDKLYDRTIRYLERRETWIRDCYVCSDSRYRLNLRVITDKPWAGLFCHNMFLRPKEEELLKISPEWMLLHATGCEADPLADGTRHENFTVIDFTRKMILIGGSAYTGEIKKSVFSVLNYLLPLRHDVLSMHCAANAGRSGDTALFFGLSGTGKTTLSSDPERFLIGDDEHGWSDDRIFNIEGGCYAKCINLREEREPQIYHAIRGGALLENVKFFKDSIRVNYSDKSITENTRVSYPVYFIENIRQGLSGGVPKNIFFLTCDAYGVLPPIARLSVSQAMYHFISGYTAKIAGTESGIDEPKAAFSACFGAPFMPLHPAKYAGMLGGKIKAHSVNCWLVNTGWTGGAYGAGKRLELAYTRALIKAALSGRLDRETYRTDPVFGLAAPVHCPGVPDTLLWPRYNWPDRGAFDKQAGKLAQMFVRNFEKYCGEVLPEVLAASPKIR